MLMVTIASVAASFPARVRFFTNAGL